MELGDLLPAQNHNFLEERATEILKQNNIKTIEDIDIENIVLAQPRTMIFYMHQRSKTIINKNMSLLIIDKRLDPLTRKIQLAEEFCHSILHAGNQCTYLGSWMLDKQETQAKRMSSYLLCPLFLLKNIPVPYDTYLYPTDLAEIFKVPVDFMEYRLHLIWEQDLNSIAYINNNAYGFHSFE